MEKIIIDRFEAAKDSLRGVFAAKHPDSYFDMVKAVVEAVTGEDYGEAALDPERIHTIDDGDYQGTLLYVIAEKGYQPDNYWYVKVSYGSCSGCDTLQAIEGYSGGKPTEDQVNQYMVLALHIAQGLKRMGD